jgi:hypothetical protein
MPLSESTLNEIRTELTSLHEVKVRIEERVRALEAILVPLDFGQAALPFLRKEERATVMQPTQARGTNLYASNGLRAAILDLLRANGPMRAPAVAKVLSTNGFNNDSKTKLSTRVYNDLWRMREAGILTNNNGAFSLKERKAINEGV